MADANSTESNKAPWQEFYDNLDRERERKGALQGRTGPMRENEPGSLSRLDAKLRRDELIDDKSEILWCGFWVFIQETKAKLNKHCSAGIEAKLNDCDSMIMATRTAPDGRSRLAIKIRFNRSEKRLIATHTERLGQSDWQSVGVYLIRADLANDTLYLERDGQRQYNTKELAEELLAEKLFGIDLDS